MLNRLGMPGKVITNELSSFTREMNDPLTNVPGYTVRSRTTLLSPDKIKFEMFNPHESEDAKMMEIVYERALNLPGAPQGDGT